MGMRLLNTLLAYILNTLFPPVCVSCKKEGDFLCEDCLKSLDKKKISPVYCKTDKDPDFHFLDGVIYALDYAKNPQIQAAVKQLKYRFTQELAEHFSNLIAEKIGELGMVKNRKIILIPVPLHKKRLNYRGFNQAAIIAKAVANKISDKKADVINLLERSKETQQQAKLNREERHKNLHGAFKINDQFCHPELSQRLNTKIVQTYTCTWGPYSVNWGLINKG
jgi:competence protein ComFC